MWTIVILASSWSDSLINFTCIQEGTETIAQALELDSEMLQSIEKGAPPCP